MPTEIKVNFKTSHIGVVAYLKYRNINPTELMVEGDTACWLFEDSEALRIYVEEYNDSRAMVNPKIYNRIFSNTKLDMFRMTRPERF